MKNRIIDLIKSFYADKGGMSGRKLTAFALMVCVGWLHLKWVTPENATEFLYADLCAVLLVLGIVTAEQIINFKNGANEDKAA